MRYRLLFVSVVMACFMSSIAVAQDTKVHIDEFEDTARSQMNQARWMSVMDEGSAWVLEVSLKRYQFLLEEIEKRVDEDILEISYECEGYVYSAKKSGIALNDPVFPANYLQTLEFVWEYLKDQVPHSTDMFTVSNDMILSLHF